ncbi:MAG: translation initiation factor IF-3 [Candidatus Eutrophobiaceae bacterium]
MRLNGKITASEVRLVDAEGGQKGVVALNEAQALADTQELDLVEVAPEAKPPVCRIMNYGKYLFEQSKKRHQARRRQKQVQIKEIKFRPGTDQGDYAIKLRNLIRFLSAGDKTKVTLRFRGREMMHQTLGAEMLKRIKKDLGDMAIVEQEPKLEGRQMVMVLRPRK